MVLRQHHAVSPVAALLCWVPFTIAMTAVILGLAVASRGLWDPLEGRALGRSVTYGLPAFEVGRVWTLATSALFTLQPLQYIPILLGFLVFGGFAEYQLGARKAAIGFIACHVFAVVGNRGSADAGAQPRLPVGDRPRPRGRRRPARPASSA